MVSTKFLLAIIMFFNSILLLPILTQAQEISILRSSLSTSGSNQFPNYQGRAYTLKQSVGQASISGTIRNKSIVVIQGFIQPQLIATNSNLEIEGLDVEIKKISNTDNYIITINEQITPIRIDIYNAVGQKKFSQNTDPYEETYISLNSYSPGCYILNIQTNSKHFSTKLIKN
jgi:hypothetical protein